MTLQPLSHEMWFAQFDVYLHRQGYRAQTAHRYRTVCRQFLQYLQERDIALEQVDLAILEAYVQRRFPRSEILQQSGMRLRSFCPEHRMTCDCQVDRFILPRGWLSLGLGATLRWRCRA